jgi:plasmid maintenance system antidote protein VapI
MNKGLVAGEAFVRQSSQPTWNQAFTEKLNTSLSQVAQLNAIKKAERMAANAKVSTYINQLNSDIDLTNLTDSQQQAVTNYLVEERNVYADAASQISKIEDTSSEEYLNLRDKMNGIQRSFSNLATQLNGFKEDKISYLKDFDDNRVSDGNEIGSLKKASRIYTDEGSMGIGPGGQVTFWDDDKLKYENYSTIQKPFLKDFAAADSIV